MRSWRNDIYDSGCWPLRYSKNLAVCWMSSRNRFRILKCTFLDNLESLMTVVVFVYCYRHIKSRFPYLHFWEKSSQFVIKAGNFSQMFWINNILGWKHVLGYVNIVHSTSCVFTEFGENRTHQQGKKLLKYLMLALNNLQMTVVQCLCSTDFFASGSLRQCDGNHLGWRRSRWWWYFSVLQLIQFCSLL